VLRRQVTASVPSWGVGAKSALRKPNTAEAAPAAAPSAPAAAAAPAPASGAWKLALDDGEDDEELVDEEELLTEEDKQRPAPGKSLAAAILEDDEDGWGASALPAALPDAHNYPYKIATRPARAAISADDCEVGKAGRKACKDCTCGRAEAEAAGIKVQLTQEMLQNPGAGSCGNVSGR
jgi:hypothetical protein